MISCDSVQIYKYLNIGSAKPSLKERSEIPHHLIDLFSPDFQIDVGLYKELAEKAIIDVISRGNVPFVVGGTGMYFNALYFGLFDAPKRSEKIRNKLEEKIKRDGLHSVYQELLSVDPESASKISPNDKRRIIRALEVYLVSGKTISELRKSNKKLPLDWLLICLLPDRKKLYERINNRVEKMLENGLVDEVRNIIEKFGDDAYALGSIGYKEVKEYLKGEINFEEMKEKIKKSTRNYAKRQFTWFKKLPGANFVLPEELKKIDELIGSFLYDDCN
ncbi:MAG: tRNA (adenosine(37)-N6)-dimethylallyltransferase MiaA [Brevinematia bacterium]